MQSIIYTQAPVCQKCLFQMRELLESTGWIHPRQGLKHGGAGQLVLQFWKYERPQTKINSKIQFAWPINGKEK